MTWITQSSHSSSACASVPPLATAQASTVAATILPPTMLHHEAICLAKESRQIAQTNYRTTVIAPSLLCGFKRLGMGERR